MGKQRVLSGMRPTGKLHVGHLFGALDNWVKLQEEYDCFFFIADWHALTTDYEDPSQVRRSAIEVVVDWLAAGLDPRKATFFVQSKLPEHAELHLLLSMITPLPWLERVPTWKEQRELVKDRDLGTYGFLGYPLLQTADIVMYKANYVPVGEDQVPHVELAREIVRRFNYLYKPVLVEPKALLTEVPRIRGTDGNKMSKSLRNTIDLSDTPEEVAAKVRPMMTDPARKRRSDPGDPEKCPVYDLHKVVTPAEVREGTVVPGCTRATIGCLDCKQVLLDHLLPVLSPISARRAEVTRDPRTVETILEEGTEGARGVARQTMAEVREAMQI